MPFGDKKMTTSATPPFFPGNSHSTDPTGGSRDLLANTKKLVAQGHTRLYSNGALGMPMTSIHIVPPVPDTFNLATRLAFARTRHTFAICIRSVRGSMDCARSGLRISRSMAGALRQGTHQIVEIGRAIARSGLRKARASFQTIRAAVKISLGHAATVSQTVRTAGYTVANNARATGARISALTDSSSARQWADARTTAGRNYDARLGSSRRHAVNARQYFVNGYATLADRAGLRLRKIKSALSNAKFVRAYRMANNWRAQLSRSLSRVFVDATSLSNYTSGIKGSFYKAGHEVQQQHDTGYTFALLKSLRWIIQAILWDAAIKPVTKICLASVGYLLVNFLIFPAHFFINASIATSITLLQFAWRLAALMYEIAAPCVIAVKMGLFSIFELLSGLVLAGGSLIVGLMASMGTYALGKAAALLIAIGGYVAGKAIQYLGAPLFYFCLALGGSALGVLVGAATAVGGMIAAVGGLAAEVALRIVGSLAAGGVLVGGYVVSIIAGITLGAYRLAKTVVIPLIYQLLAGFIIFYCTLVQVCAHVVLAVADMLYLILSLEGPRWVWFAARPSTDARDIS